MRQVHMCRSPRAASGVAAPRFKWECELGARRVAVAIAFVCAMAGVLGVVCTGARADAGCPNEALRQELRSGGLPDCRAYEMVSPVFKDGSYLAGVDQIARDGSHMIGTALGAFAGSESDPFNAAAGAVYELSRTDSGWKASPLDPPASMSPDLAYFGASRDLGRTLWQLRGPSQSIYEGDLYVREPEGQLIKIGPLVPPSQSAGPPAGTETNQIFWVQFVGASDDLSRIVIDLTPEAEQVNLLWPGDTTLPGEPSLYEYAGTGLARPALVGVSSEGKLISNCGTELGGASEAFAPQEKYNAVSASGERIFFTALSGGECLTPAVNELYARINGSETIPISEPSFDQCFTCRTTAKEPAEFQGASEDGSKVFFTTAQELLSGHVGENLYEYDFDNLAGQKIVLASSGTSEAKVQGVARVSEDGSHVYFVAKGVLAGTNREGNSPALEADNLYEWERDAAHPQGRTVFIARLTEADEADWRPADARPVQATPDGRFLVFTSSGDLTPDDTSTVSQVFEYDATSETLVRVSVGQNGYNNNGNTAEDPAEISVPEYAGRGIPTEAESHLAMSDDGSYVFFTSRDALTPQAVEAASGNALNVYEYHSSGPIAAGEVELVSDGKDVTEEGIELYGTDASGTDVFFRTADSLIPTDVNTEKDVYDARVDGGFAEPVAPMTCKGEACQGAPSMQPSLSVPGSVSVQGAGNLSPPPPPIPVTKQKSKPLTRAQKLANALKACRRKPKKKRPACEKQARRTYAAARKATKSRNGVSKWL